MELSGLSNRIKITSLIISVTLVLAGCGGGGDGTTSGGGASQATQNASPQNDGVSTTSGSENSGPVTNGGDNTNSNSESGASKDNLIAGNGDGGGGGGDGSGGGSAGGSGGGAGGGGAGGGEGSGLCKSPIALSTSTSLSTVPQTQIRPINQTVSEGNVACENPSNPQPVVPAQ